MVEKNKQELNIIKIDFDLLDVGEVIKILHERLQFLIKLKMFNKKLIKKVELLKKDFYSCKIYLNKSAKNPETLILFQSILGDDYKRTIITLRDFNSGVRNWNRLFLIKRYISGEYKKANLKNITKIILDKLK
ncbi:MAG: hypothetical protein ACTSRG_22665 [Candidatus Helarchaeota archaeon]